MTLLSHADYERIAANLSYPTESFIGGTFAPALSGETMPTVNPATGKEIARVASCGREDVDKAVAAARKAPGNLNYGSPGSGTSIHLAAVLPLTSFTTDERYFGVMFNCLA